MATLVEINQVGKREDLRDFITITDAKEKPFSAMVPKLPGPVNMLIEWQADQYDDPAKDGVADGRDVTSFENAAKDRALVQNYAQKWRRTAMVGDIAENVSNVAGAPEGDLARSIEKKLEEIGRDIEATLCSDNSAQLETDSSTPYQTRGLGAWIASSYSGVDATQVPLVARPPGASIDATGGSLTEGQLQAVLASIYSEHGRRSNLVMLCGTTVKQDVSGFTQTQFASTDTGSTIRTFNQDLSAGTITHNVTVYEGDFNTVELHPSLLLRHSSGATGDVNTAFILPMERYGLGFNRMPRVKQLEDQGGGPRALIDAIAGLIARNPRSSGKIT